MMRVSPCISLNAHGVDRLVLLGTDCLAAAVALNGGSERWKNDDGVEREEGENRDVCSVVARKEQYQNGRRPHHHPFAAVQAHATFAPWTHKVTICPATLASGVVFVEARSQILV
jgi:hypothetical protein